MPYNAETIVVGCGNTLFKDDGFGPRSEEHTSELQSPG